MNSSQLILLLTICMIATVKSQATPSALPLTTTSNNNPVAGIATVVITMNREFNSSLNDLKSAYSLDLIAKLTGFVSASIGNIFKSFTVTNFRSGSIVSTSILEISTVMPISSIHRQLDDARTSNLNGAGDLGVVVIGVTSISSSAAPIWSLKKIDQIIHWLILFILLIFSIYFP
jgi:hypothetical protein